MRLLIIIFLILSCASSQDLPITEGPDPAPPEIDIMEPPVVDDLGQGQPIPIFQELPKATITIEYWFSGEGLGESDFNQTAWDEMVGREWLELLNQTNMTA